MRGPNSLIMKLLAIIAVLAFGGAPPASAGELQTFTKVELVNDPANDGDSFVVLADGKQVHVRLYFVDCPEISVTPKSAAERVREQTRYFGLPKAERTVHFGREAKALTERSLAKPFTLHTAFARAPGASSRGRVYAFVTTAEGKDLASVLVESGLARTHGVRRGTPDGTSAKEMDEGLSDLESSAMLKRIGIWSESDPDRIAELRAEQREDDREVAELQGEVKRAAAAAENRSPANRVDLNTASEAQLQSVKGIGAVLAKRIIAGRPYKSVEDLLKIQGIGPKTLEKMRARLTAGPAD